MIWMEFELAPDSLDLEHLFRLRGSVFACQLGLEQFIRYRFV